MTYLLPIRFRSTATLPGADGAANRAVPHLHGGFTPWSSDGGPMAWFTPNNAETGEDFVSSHYEYPNDQTSRLMFYHDHAMGTTRLNVHAGLAAPYILRDPVENLMINLHLLPSGAYEVPLVLQDKSFDSHGLLLYPSVYDAEIGPHAEGASARPVSGTRVLRRHDRD